MKKYIIAAGSSVIAMAFALSLAAQSVTFTSNLSVGTSGGDVASLQNLLIAKGFHIYAIESGAVAAGYFGPQTERAVMAYQAAIGLPNTGFVGPLTRARLNLTNSMPATTMVTNDATGSTDPVVNSVNGPASLTVGQSGTWTVNATDPLNRTMNYSADWGDARTGLVSSPGSMVTNATFTHSYSSPGTYIVKFAVSDSAGLVAEKSVTVTVTGNASAVPSLLSILTPNGNEIWIRGSSHNITWVSPYGATYGSISIYAPRPSSCNASCGWSPILYTIASNVNLSQNSYTWVAGHSDTGTVPDGTYMLQICDTTGNCVTSHGSFSLITQ